MTIYEICNILKVSETYLRSHFWIITSALSIQGILLTKDGNDYSIAGLDNCRIFSLEEICTLFNYSQKNFKKNFKKIQESKEKCGIIIFRIGRGDNTTYYLKHLDECSDNFI